MSDKSLFLISSHEGSELGLEPILPLRVGGLLGVPEGYLVRLDTLLLLVDGVLTDLLMDSLMR